VVDPGKTRLHIRLLGRFFALVLSLVRASWRVDSSGLEPLDRLSAAGAKVLVVFWHGKYLPLFALLQGRRACILASRSFRGEVICAICRRFGYDCLQLPGHPGGPGEETIHRAMTASTTVATALDGPLGPHHHVRRGLLRTAGGQGFQLLPVSLAARRRLVLRGRWDRMELPAPFTRIHLAFGDPISPPARLAAEETEILARRLQKALEDLDRLAGERVRDQGPPPGSRAGGKG
jgi:lysophospholipid acyltransferase (LPLAT)-like uncharacterized protein